MTRPAGTRDSHCPTCRVVTLHEADIVSPARPDEVDFAVLTCTTCGQLTPAGIDTDGW